MRDGPSPQPFEDDTDPHNLSPTRRGPTGQLRTLLHQGDLAAAFELAGAQLLDDPDHYLSHVRASYVAAAAGDPAGAARSQAWALDSSNAVGWLDPSALQRDTIRPRFAGSLDRAIDVTGRRQFEFGRRLTDGVRQRSKSQPLVTIVTVVYENDATLQRCIDSVRAQTYPNVEFVVVDGGSSAPTLEILQSNADALDYCVSEPDGGIYAAMNKGIQLAQGDYICLLNSDDFYAADFIEKSVALAQKIAADIVYSDYWHGETRLAAQSIGPGVLLGHLNICHNTFLTSRHAYDAIGPYREDFRIVSDAVWIRRAFRAGLRFACISEPLFTLSEGGMSSGGTEARRRIFIDEVVQTYRESFPELTPDEAEELYLFRFNKNRSEAVLTIARRHESDPLFRAALGAYVAYCFATRANFALHHSEADSTFPIMAALARETGAGFKCLRINTKHCPLPTILEGVDSLISKRKTTARRTILHFVTVFSAPSETFIYDLITDLHARPDCDNFILFEHAKLGEERPFENGFHMPWGDFSPSVASEIYRYFFECLSPDLIISHFAINAHRLEQRIAPLGLRYPTLVMTHGIDVFTLKEASDYTSFVLEDLAPRDDVSFTAVSAYLKQKLVDAGVNKGKIALVPNSVSTRFAARRKTDGFWTGDRQLKLLSIGRLIDWKGHDVLIEALALARNSVQAEFRLALVYGNGSERLGKIKALIEKHGLEHVIELIPFVDLNANPDFFAQFDLFVHPSTYSSDKLRKSETFGVSVLEAITAGLPVLTTDAGGLPEVIGPATRFARIVPNGNAEAMAAALIDMTRTADAFQDNRDYAEERLAAFAPERRVSKLLRVADATGGYSVNVALFSTSTIQGAGYAAYRLHRGLQNTSVNSRIFTTVRNHEDRPGVTVLSHPSGDNTQWQAKQFKPKAGNTIFSIDDEHLPNEMLRGLVADADVINLHWHARFLSAENVASLTKLNKPVVLTVRDMHPLTGGCHFFHGCSLWTKTCQNCPQLIEKHGGVAERTLAYKRLNYNFDALTLVVLSHHTRRLVEQAPMFSNCRVELISNSIETDVFKPHDKTMVRQALDLPLDRPIIGYVPSFSSKAKGYDELTKALNALRGKLPGGDPFVMLIGSQTPATEAIRLEKRSLGYINDNAQLARAYSAADLIVVPSLEETFSNTTAEALSCGVPVVGFKTGALPDLILDGQTGYTCTTGDSSALSEAILRVLLAPSMGPACRAQAVRKVSFMTQARRYAALFEELAHEQRAAART